MNDDHKINPVVFRTKLRHEELAKLRGEKLFEQYCKPKMWLWQYPEWKQAALDLLNSSLFVETSLKGTNKSGNYPLIWDDQNLLGDLFIDLVQEHFRRGLGGRRLEGDLSKEILEDFDTHFSIVAARARLGGVRRDELEGKQRKWRDKVLNCAKAGKIPHHWRSLVWDLRTPGRGYALKLTTQETARAFAEVLLRYVPKASANLIAKWVLVVLKTLKRPIVNQTRLRSFIHRRKKDLEQTEEIAD